MLRHPARHYIYYLFSKRGLTNAQIIEHLDDLRLPLPQEANALVKFAGSLVKERQRVVVPQGFDPIEPTMNSQTIEFLSTWRIFDMWRHDDFVKCAVDILFEPMIRRMIEALLLGPINPAAVARRVGTRFGLPESVMNLRVIKAYSHYFWDVSAMSNPEWKSIVAGWMPGDINNNDYIAALSAPRSPAGAALVLALVDRSAESLSPILQYTAMRDHGFGMFMEHALLQSRPSLPRTQAAFMAFQMVRMADEELTKHRGGSADLLDELKKIETIYDSAKIASVQDLPALMPPRDIADAELVEEPKDEEIA